MAPAERQEERLGQLGIGVATKCGLDAMGQVCADGVTEAAHIGVFGEQGCERSLGQGRIVTQDQPRARVGPR